MARLALLVWQQRSRILPVVLALIAVPLILVAMIAGAITAVLASSSSDPSQSAVADIPPRYLQLYQTTGQTCGVDWAILAAIGKVESDHGRSREPGVTSGSNSAGAAGPMQIGIGGAAGNSWGTYGRDGNKDHKKDVYDPEDAIPGACAYLKGNGAPKDIRRAIFAYNHAGWYVDKVLSIADSYRAAAAASTPTVAGLVNFEGSPCAAWIAQALTQARHDGVQFQITPGNCYRSVAQQEQTCNTPPYPQPCAAPGKSRHQGIKYPDGAVDLSSGIPALDAYFRRKGIPLQSSEIHLGVDPPHFSSLGLCKTCPSSY